MDVLLISNPNSTSITQRKLASIIPVLRSVPEIRLLSQFTQYAGHAEEMARQARTQGWDAVVAIGGDGTVSEVINGLLEEPTDDPDSAAHNVLTVNLPALGIIPTGSANVFARAVGFSADTSVAVRQLAEALTKNERRLVTLGAWADLSSNSPDQHRWIAVNAGLGIDAEVIHEMEKRRALGLSASPLRYVFLAAQTWLKGASPGSASQPIHVKAEGKDGPLETKEAPLAFVSHTDPWTYLGPFPIRIAKPGTEQDGFSVFALRRRNGVRPLLALSGLLFPWLRKGFGKETQTMACARTVKLHVDEPRDFQVDGEYVGEFTYIGLTFIPDAMEILSPAPEPRSAR